MNREARHGIGGVGLLLALATLAGCLPPDVESDAPTPTSGPPAAADLPPMEEVIVEHEEMVREIIVALEIDPGGLVWDEVASLELRRVACPDDPRDAERAVIEGLHAIGTYEGQDGERAAQVVADIIAAHGFDESMRLVEPESVRVRGEDDRGANFIFASESVSTITLETGCHEWVDRPGPEHTRPPLLDTADNDV